MTPPAPMCLLQLEVVCWRRPHRPSLPATGVRGTVHTPAPDSCSVLPPLRLLRQGQQPAAGRAGRGLRQDQPVPRLLLRPEARQQADGDGGRAGCDCARAGALLAG